MKNNLPALKMLIKKPDINEKILSTGLAALVCIAFVFFVEQLLRSPCCDADQYLRIAKEYNEKGISSVAEQMRTFAYPWVVSMLMGVADIFNIPVKFFIFIFQLFAYFFVIVVTVNMLSLYSRKVAAAIYILLCVNVFVLPYVGITLTDSLYTSMSLFLIMMLTQLDSLKYKGECISWRLFFFASFMVSFSIVLRPSAVWLLIPFTILFFKLIVNKNARPFSSVLFVFLGTFPLWIQIFLNVLHFRNITFFPAVDLGGLQIKWGIEYIKYATWLGGEVLQNYYPSENLVAAHLSDSGLLWYVQNPVDAVKLLTLKLVGAFDFDYLMPYSYTKSFSDWFWSFFSFSIFLFGLLGTFWHLVTNKLTVLGGRALPFTILVAWGTTSLSSALELRFTLPLLTYFIVVSCVTVNEVFKLQNKRLKYGVVAYWVGGLYLLYLMADFVRDQSSLLG